MKLKRRLLRAGSILAVALAAGYVAQTWNAEKLVSAQVKAKPENIEKVSAGATDTAPAANPALPAAASLAAPPATADIAALPSLPAAKPAATPPVDLAALTPPEIKSPAPAIAPPVEPMLAAAGDPVKAAPAPSAETAAPLTPAAAADCTPKLTLAAGPRAMIAVNLVAPCAAGERVVLRHAGLAVAESLGEDGTLALDLPALNDRGEVSVLFADASVARASVPVPEAAGQRRFAVQWMADDTFQLHAYENGAAYGEPGDVSALNPVSASGGYLVALGDPTLELPMLAEVYTWPADAALRAEVVVESAVTETTCARELLGETIHAAKGAVTVTDLTVAMPDCDAVGDILVLNNLVPDVTLAAAN